MTVEIRPCRDAEELARFHAVESYVFANNDGYDADSAPMDPGWTTCAFVDGKLATTLGTLPFTVRLNGNPVPMGGVTAVGTLPEERRRGLLRQVMREALSTMRDHGQAYAILWASMAAIYQRFGYGLASSRVRYSFDPRFASFQRDEPATGSVTMTPVQDAFPIIKQLYIQWASPRNLHLHRATPLWEIDVLRAHPKTLKVYVAIYRNTDGEARGYAVYTTTESQQDGPGPNQVLDVKDFIWLDLEAYRALWEYLRRHDLVGKIQMTGVVAEDDPAPDLLLEPRMLNRRTTDGIWMRIVDLEEAVPQRPYGARGELTFAIDGDDMCPWNNGTFLLETDGTMTDIRRVDRAPSMTMLPATLSTLLSGHRSATHMARAGRLECVSPEALRTADAIFATAYAPNCPNNF